MPSQSRPLDINDLFSAAEAPLAPPPTTSTPPSAANNPVSAQPTDDGPAVNIPLEDVTHRVKEINEAADYARTLALRQQQMAPQETTAEYNERVKREFYDKVMEARRQRNAPPPPPQPVHTAISEQTRREMEAGKRQSAYWAEQQKLRPGPSARDLQAAGTNTPVFQPQNYAHEKGVGVKGKDYTVQTIPGR